MTDLAVTKRNGGESLGLRRDLEPLRLMRGMLGLDPFRELVPLMPAAIAGYTPAFEVKETKDAYVFKADLPGVKDSDLEVTVAGQPRNDAVVVDGSLHGPGDRMRFVYRSVGDPGTVEVKQALDGTRYVRLPLGSREFAILE